MNYDYHESQVKQVSPQGSAEARVLQAWGGSAVRLPCA